MKRGAHDQRGVVTIWAALFLLSVIGVTSLGIDMAKLMATRTQLQNAADAAALAGASAIDPATGIIIPDSARVRAQVICSYNKAFVDGEESVDLPVSDIEVLGGNLCRVTVRREGGQSVVTHFAKVFGVRSLEMRAVATARVGPSQTVSCNIIPLAAIPTGAPFRPGCNPGYALKESSQGGSGGNYKALRFPSCGGGACAGMSSSGANTFECLVKNGMCCPVSINDQLTPETGNMAGPTRAGINARFNRDTDSRSNICYSQYRGNGQRVVITPITTAPTAGTSTPVTVTGFAVMFLKTIPGSGANSTITGEFIDMVVPGVAGATPGGASAYSIQLVE